MALKTGTAVSIRGAVGPASVVTVSAPPGPNVGVVGGYAIQAANTGGVVLLYGPKTASGWTQTAPDNVGNTLPVSVQLTGAKGDAGTNGATIRATSGVPDNSVGNVGDIAIDGTQGFVYGPKVASGWPSQPLVSTVGPEGPKGSDGPATPLPNNYTGNSFTVSPVANDANAVQFAIKNSAGTVLWSADASGNTTVGGTLKVTGASTLAAVNAASLATTGAATVGTSLGVTGTTNLTALNCTSATNTGNESIGGTLQVNGTSSLAGVSATTLAVSGATTLGSTLGVTGASTLAAVSATTVSASSNATVGGTLAVTGATNAAAITASGLVTAPNFTLTSGGGGKLTFADGTSMTTAATGTGAGTGTSSGSGGASAIDTIFMGTFAAAGNFPTAYSGSSDAYFVNTQYSQAGTASRSGSAYAVTYAGTVYSIQGYVVLGVAGPVSICLFKNGVATSLVATYSNSANGGPFYQAASTSTPISVAVGDVLQLFVKSTSSNTSTPLVGHVSLLQSGVASAGSSSSSGTSGVGGIPSRSVVFLGTYWNNAYTANSSNNTYHATLNTNGNSLGATGAPFRFDLAGAVVGYSLTQAGPVTGVNTVQLYKNGTAFGAAITAGSGSTSFGTTFSNSTYAFAAGDVLTAYVSNSAGGNTQISLHVTVEWLGATLGGAASMDLGFYWPGSGAYPTSLTVNSRTITSGSTVATVPSVNTVSTSGTIVGINGLVFGSTGGKNYTFSLYKNGVATGLTATANSTSNTGPGTVWQSPSSSTAVNYVAGDYFQIFSSAESGATSQATYAFATYATAASSVIASGGGSGSGIAISPLDMGTYWNSSVPTTYTNFIQTIYQTSAATMAAFATMPYAGTVKKIAIAYNGTIGGTVTVALYKNGNVTSVTATQGPITISSTAQLTSFIGDGGGLTFAAGDTFMFYIKNSGSTTNQAFKGTLHVAFTGVS